MMILRKTLPISLTGILVVGSSLALIPNAANAANYTGKRIAVNKPCPVLAYELASKITRLKHLANEKRAEGNAYGERRLLSTANVIAAHRGNLPCVNRRTCGI